MLNCFAYWTNLDKIYALLYAFLWGRSNAFDRLLDARRLIFFNRNFLHVFEGLHKKWGYQRKALFQGFSKMPPNLLQLKRKAEKIDDKGKSVPSDSMQKMAIRSIFGLLNVSFLIPTYLYLCLLDILLFDNGVGKKRTAKWLKINSWLTWNSFL